MINVIHKELSAVRVLFNHRTIVFAAGRRIGIGCRVGCRIRFIVGLGRCRRASLGGDQVFVFAEDLVHRVDKAVDNIRRLQYGIGINALDDQIERLVLAVLGFQLGDIRFEMKGLQRRCHFGLGQVDQ